ncbi:hypothetical protein LZK73_18405 [Neorhizobium galegae]|nr:hypothetical protein LZK73_18405 [Neorhizobium galegae]
MANILEGTQSLPEGETVRDPGTTPAPELNDDQQHSDADNGDAGEEGKGAAEGNEGEGAGAEEGTGEGQQEEPSRRKSSRGS